MGWKTRRNGNRYFYRSRRVDGRVVTEYVGSGAAAEQVAAEMTKRQERGAADRAEREQLHAVMRDLTEAKRLANVAVASVLEAAGYHQHHRGEWRKRRVARSS